MSSVRLNRIKVYNLLLTFLYHLVFFSFSKSQSNILQSIGMVHGDVDEKVMDAIKEHMDTCTKELQITPEEMEVLIKNEDLDDEMKTKSGCYNACVLKHLNLMKNLLLTVSLLLAVMTSQLAIGTIILRTPIAYLLIITNFLIALLWLNTAFTLFLSIKSLIRFVYSAVRADFVDSYLAAIKDQMLTCGKENGFTEQVPREIYDKDAEMGADKASCLRACVMKSTGMIKDSKLNMEKLNEFVKMVHADNPEKVKPLEKAINECVDKVKDTSDECKMAFSYVECFLSKH
ncbi:hypothetical protein ANTQUA_LOCUS10033 [Anthophora quadrimaculata]